MAAQPAAEDQDQSMEEILQSIKRIIADEDDDDADVQDDTPRNTGSDVLELTDIVQDDGTVVDAAKAEAPPKKAETPAKPTSFEETPIPAVAAAPAKAKPEPQPDPLAFINDDEDSSLISSAAASASSDALRALAASKKPAPKPKSESSGLAFRSGETVEDLVTEMMRPMLKEWLDTNLPGIVERLVEREVKRISGQ